MHKLTAVAVAAIGLLIMAGCGKSGSQLAKVGKETITEQEFRDAFLTRFRSEDNIKQRTLDDRKRFLREMALERAKYQEGVARKYDQNTDIAEQVENTARRRALDLLYQAKVVDQVLSEASQRDYYDKSGKEVLARHILLKKTPQDTTEADRNRLKTRIDSIKSAIQGGLEFRVAAAQLSEDATTAPDSGDLGWFPWGRMVDEFQQACWAAQPGKLAGPVESPFGWHLIMVDSTRKVEGRQSYEDMKDEIAGRMREASGQKLSDIARAYVDQLHADYALKLETKVLDEFRAKLQDPQMSLNQELGPMFTEEEKQKVAATHKLGKVTVQDMIQKIGGNAYRVDWKTEQSTLDLVHAIAEPMFLEDRAEQEGFLKKALADPQVVEQKRQAVMRLLEKVEVTDKLDLDASADSLYYATHLQDFIQPEQRTIREIFIKEDSSKAARVHQRAKKGEDFSRLAAQFNEKESTLRDQGKLGPFEEKRFGVIGKTAFRLQEVGEISDVVKIGNNYSVIQLLEIFPSRTKTWDEAKAEARRENRVLRTKVLQDQLEAMLFERYPLTLNEEQLAGLWPLPPDRSERAARDQ